MVLGKVIEAIGSAWTAGSLGTTFTGGLFAGTAVSTTDDTDVPNMPYVVFQIIGSARRDRSTSLTSAKVNEYKNTQVQFLIYTNAGLEVAGDLADTLRAVYDDGSLTVTGATALHMSFVSEFPVHVEDAKYTHVWRWTITYDILHVDETNLT